MQRKYSILVLTVSFCLFVHFALHAQSPMAKDTLVYDAWVASPNFSFDINHASAWSTPRKTINTSDVLGETLLVRYSPDQRIDYQQAVQQGIYINRFSRLHQFMVEAVADSVHRLYDSTHLAPDALAKSTVSPAATRLIPVNSYWKESMLPLGFYIARATFKYVSVGVMKIEIPDFHYRKAQRGKKRPVQAVRVPVYFITDIISFDSSAPH